MPVLSDQVLAAEVEDLAATIAGIYDKELLEEARRIAEAQIDLARIRRLRHTLAGVLSELLFQQQESIINAAQTTDTTAETPCIKDLRQSPPGSESNTLGTVVQQLASLDRYERRALSRRKSAIRSYVQFRFSPHRNG